MCCQNTISTIRQRNEELTHMSKLTMEIVVHLSPGQFVPVSSRVLLGKEQHTNLQQTQQLSVKRSNHVMFHEVNTYSDIRLVIIIDILAQLLHSP